MSVAFQLEKFEAAFADAVLLLEAHFKEIAPYQDLFYLNPDLEFYAAAERAGRLLTVTARDDTRLIGYFVMLVYRHPHYKHVITATEDLHFLHANYRRGWTGVKLMKAAENIARDRGVVLLTGRAKAKSEHGALYRRLGYDLMDEVYTKRLDR